MESPDFFIMEDDNDLGERHSGVGLSITCPTSLDEFADSIEVEVETDPLDLDFDLSPPSLFYPQLHSLFMKPGVGAMGDPTSLNLDEKTTDLPSPKYFIKTMKPKRRPPAAEAEDPYQCFSNDITNTPSSGKHMRKVFYCRSCGKSFKFQTSLLRHNNKVHISKYTCPTCHRVFSRQAYLDVHTSKVGSSCYLGHFKKSK
ncbi:RB-associated KRAB zinc finger protein-like isoform X1 [Diaphorina citri]|uniref:RB-associated KRAB zinc finger protein-like isoform X1 n=1 Tax=Diaphorina citri TaxID=121845 RepID=A0A3Q0J561_DIACI|nr:RB-associated KRAB zinc finger protein-like isoform X1 [Diaphorina citri]